MLLYERTIDRLGSMASEIVEGVRLGASQVDGRYCISTDVLST